MFNIFFLPSYQFFHKTNIPIKGYVYIVTILILTIKIQMIKG